MNDSNIWAGAVLMVGTLGMVTLGGGFLLGVMIIASQYAAICQQVTLSGAIELSVAESNLIRILYICAFASFGTAAFLLYQAVKTLKIN